METFWAFYFFAKLGMHAQGTLRVHFFPNFLLLIATLPFSEAKKNMRPFYRRLLLSATLIAGLALLWYDSYLPPFLYSMRFILEHPSAAQSGFLHEFLPGFFSGKIFLTLIVLLALCLAASRGEMNLTFVVFLALLFPGIQEFREPRGLIANRLFHFHETERGRKVELPKTGIDSPFDIILIHICSLSWDDLEAAGVPKPRALAGANYIFTRFNSATSYSGPAALRLLRAPCGQAAHQDLYEPWPKGCSLVEDLRASGFHTYAAVNFPPDSYGQERSLRQLADLDKPMSLDGVPVELLSFDNEKIFKNYPILERWWTSRANSAESRAAFYYNTVSLHGGIHADNPDWWKMPKTSRYVKSLNALGTDLDRFYGLIETSGRSAIVLIVPEHGMALRGSPVQGAELRDIPLPRITYVPVAIRFIGPLFAKAPRDHQSDKPMSYLALAQLLADLIKDPSLANDASRLDHAVAELPETEFLSETEEWKVFRFQGQYYVYGKDKAWQRLPPEEPIIPARSQI